MKVTNISDGPRGLNTASGIVFLAVGEEADVTLEKGEAASARSTGWFKFGAGASDDAKEKQPDSAATLTPQPEPAAPPAPAASAFAVKEKAAGWYVITKDGAEVTKSLRKAEVEGFDKLSPNAQATFVERNKADA